ncbi:MAG TPA: bifunctional glutamate N-acetyltransferase/amino-acid acetyltransferase ArgJ [Terriglobia bacterium]|nr:bifunctional glutamate N-acetyltransferase/amino-acid acetyltransferase ArgJ [Terriglobia bacterium]
MIIRGFKTAAVAAGIKAGGALDLALICSETPATAAAVFTQNFFIAAPLLVTRRHLLASGHQVRAVLVNSGNANAATGDAGIQAAEECVEALARELKCDARDVLVSSTGVIGRPLPVTRIQTAIPNLVSSLSPSNLEMLARGIMTTDTVPKIATAEMGGARIAGVAKGAGMIHPDMATMLSFVMTDADVAQADLDSALRYAVHHSFNSISVDGDTSTNDMVVVLANGASGIHPSAGDFRERLREVCTELATAIVRDGEGATKFVELNIEGAPSDDAARTIGRTIARSPLVKTAIYGADPNWGRIVGAIGNSGVPLRSDRVDIYIGGVPISDKTLEEARQKLKAREIQIRVVLHSGSGTARIWTCDLTEGYIRINADYTT